MKSKNNCLYCNEETTNKKFCTITCAGFFRRGKCRDNYNLQSKHHIRILVDGERKYLHRYIVEQEIRALKSNEIVHHIDNNKFNNDVENLEILSGRKAHLHKHNYHRKAKQGKETEFVEGIPF